VTSASLKAAAAASLDGSCKSSEVALASLGGGFKKPGSVGEELPDFV
jgi:hypothetical protein